VKLASSADRARGEVEGSEGGRVPDMYVVVRNDELLRVKYLLLYRQEAAAKGALTGPCCRHETSRLDWLGGGRLLAWLGRHKMLLLLLAYAAMLAAIGLANSQWARRWLRRHGWAD
jgi:poly[ADP-ribose] polymerase 16